MSQTDEWTIRSLLEWTASFFEKKDVETPRLEAEVLLAFALGKSRVDLYVNYDVVPSEEERRAFRDLVKRRGAGEPVAYLVGNKEFYCLDFEVNRSVLIPRPETEQLVLEVIEDVKRRDAAFDKAEEEAASAGESAEEAAEDGAKPFASGRPKYWRFCDLGAGSGCIAVALAKNISNSMIAALDVNEEALALTKKNAAKHEVEHKILCVKSDVFSGFPGAPPEEKRLDYLLSNPPYISEEEYERLEPTVREYEPREALVGGKTGAEIALRIVAEAPDYLKVGGKMYLELSPTTVEIVADAMRADERWTGTEILKDFARLDRYVVGTRCK